MQHDCRKRAVHLSRFGAASLLALVVLGSDADAQQNPNREFNTIIRWDKARRHRTETRTWTAPEGQRICYGVIVRYSASPRDRTTQSMRPLNCRSAEVTVNNPCQFASIGELLDDAGADSNDARVRIGRRASRTCVGDGARSWANVQFSFFTAAEGESCRTRPGGTSVIQFPSC